MPLPGEFQAGRGHFAVLCYSPLVAARYRLARGCASIGTSNSREPVRHWFGGNEPLSGLSARAMLKSGAAEATDQFDTDAVHSA
jgi:hypothetical protein